jgi:hypothetical protein
MFTGFIVLSNVALEDIRYCFNESFKDYFTPFNLSAEQFENKLQQKQLTFLYPQEFLKMMNWQGLF